MTDIRATMREKCSVPYKVPVVKKPMDEVVLFAPERETPVINTDDPDHRPTTWPCDRLRQS